ncbi:methyltransferase type 11 [Nocardioides baekrokdamisoli]|uniref:Methyltransferase type 11 n=1 Tax=Nocardioides baekrokdamisoli TaxID=1804624 RepID=A0A3G9IFR2_9ACTN|nr:methyltransferase domain-containing protein [Nocardioides baekrokdamisoli]BBH17807.1 methyltransferase type 11 [Nocardioides baekrokdamisoli]
MSRSPARRQAGGLPSDGDADSAPVESRSVAAGRRIEAFQPRRSPNIWDHPGTYEIENRAADPDGALWAAMSSIASWADRDVLDLGCGTGFHLPLFASTARSVVGVEPNPDLVALARRRTRRLASVDVIEGLAEQLPLADASVDVVHARWAYFFGPGSEPGLTELDRVIAPGGTALIIDNDPTRSTFGRWFAEGFPTVDAAAVESFWAERGWAREQVDMGWRFESREDLEAVVRLELPPTVAEAALVDHPGLAVDYAVNLWWKRF